MRTFNFCYIEGHLRCHISLTHGVCYRAPVPDVGRVFAATFSKLCSSPTQGSAVDKNVSSGETGNYVPPPPPANDAGRSINGFSIDATKDVERDKGVPLPFKDAYPKVRVETAE